jgi:hypothetical protein
LPWIGQVGLIGGHLRTVCYGMLYGLRLDGWFGNGIWWSTQACHGVVWFSFCVVNWRVCHFVESKFRLHGMDDCVFSQCRGRTVQFLGVFVWIILFFFQIIYPHAVSNGQFQVLFGNQLDRSRATMFL